MITTMDVVDHPDRDQAWDTSARLLLGRPMP